MSENSTIQECCIEDVRDTVQRMVRIIQLFERDQIKIYDFTSTQCYSLIELGKTNQMTMLDLSEKMNLNTSTMTRIVDKLVKRNLVERKRDEADRRIVLVSLTEEGTRSARKLNNSLSRYYERILENLPDGKISSILNSSELLIAAFEKANPNCC